jgi:hypothetical protein
LSKQKERRGEKMRKVKVQTTNNAVSFAYVFFASHVVTLMKYLVNV